MQRKQRRQADNHAADRQIAESTDRYPLFHAPALDDIDRMILALLLEDSRRTHKEIGEQVHLTGQAVGTRVRRMQENGVIHGYTLRWNPAQAGVGTEAFVTVFLDSGTIHASFLAFAQKDERVAELDRTSGEGCYLLKVRTGSPQELNDFLQALLRYGNYRVNLSMGRLKG
nr:Lrp/AsnC family transcriptional regulator [Saccharibacillus sp. JS10]